MFNSGLAIKGLSLAKIIGGLSKTLQIANQVIPIYQKAKPMIKNARSIMNVLKTINKTSSQNNETKIANKNNLKINIKKANETKKEENTSPTFFL